MAATSESFQECHAATEMFVMRDGRVEPRRVIISRVELRWQDGIGAARVSTALLEDTSKRGACIRVAEPIAAGTRVQVVRRGEDFGGLVKNCRRDGSGYRIGIHRQPYCDATPKLTADRAMVQP